MPNVNLKLHQPGTYRIEVEGHLDKSWAAWFDDMAIEVEARGDQPDVTTLTGPLADQTALHGVIARIRDLGLPLLLVRRIEDRPVE
jgi:hypothetical protein